MPLEPPAPPALEPEAPPAPLVLAVDDDPLVLARYQALFEGLGLMALIRRLDDPANELRVALLVGLLAAGLPYGYLIGLIAGPLLVALNRRRSPSSAA